MNSAREVVAFLRIALLAIRILCKEQRTFYSDDVWAAIGRTQNVDLRYLGHAFKIAKARGWCERTGDYRLVTDTACHQHLRPVWRSNIYDPGSTDDRKYAIPKQSFKHISRRRK